VRASALIGTTRASPRRVHDTAAAPDQASGRGHTSVGSAASSRYEPRDPARTVLHQLVRAHLETFLAATAVSSDDAALPFFVVKEFRDFLGCGALGRGFARFRCGECAFERLVPFSCKRRGICPSCGGRRMTAQAAHLVDAVLPQVPCRQWVLTLPYRLRYILAWDHALCRAVLAVYVRALLGFQRRKARSRDVEGRGGAVTVIQRFGSALNLNVHFHTLVLDGVFQRESEGRLRFYPSPPPTDLEVAGLLETIRSRILRLLRRRGLIGEDIDPEAQDPFVSQSSLLAGLSNAAVLGRVALGPRAGRRIRRIGTDPDAPWITSPGPRQAHVQGFDLHANVAVARNDRTRLESLCRYLLRPAISQERLKLTPGGDVLVELRSTWSDGTTHLHFGPLELLEKLAALIPRPRINLLLYHGVLAPHARDRREASAYGRSSSDGVSSPSPIDSERATIDDEAASAVPDPEDQAAPAAAQSLAARRAWANLMRRAFDFDVLACPRCGGRMRLLATIDNPTVVRRILTSLGLPTEVPEPVPARSPPDTDSPTLFDEPAH
jgi:hypothetical protein